MNEIDTTLVRILVHPHRVEDHDLCCWEMKVIGDCYGDEQEYLIRGVSKKALESYKEGDRIPTNLRLPRKEPLPLPEPKPCDTELVENLRQATESYIDYLNSEESNEDRDEDYQHNIFEAAVELYYGEDIWDWVNKKIDERE